MILELSYECISLKLLISKMQYNANFKIPIVFIIIGSLGVSVKKQSENGVGPCK